MKKKKFYVLDLYYGLRNIEATVSTAINENENDIKTIILENTYTEDELKNNSMYREQLIKEILLTIGVIPKEISDIKYLNKYKMSFDVEAYDINKKKNENIKKIKDYIDKLKTIDKIKNTRIELSRIIDIDLEDDVITFMIKNHNKHDVELEDQELIIEKIESYLKTSCELEGVAENLTNNKGIMYKAKINLNRNNLNKYTFKGKKVYGYDATYDILDLGKDFSALYNITRAYKDADDYQKSILKDAGLEIKDDTIYLREKKVAYIKGYAPRTFLEGRGYGYDATFDLLINPKKLFKLLRNVNADIIISILKFESDKKVGVDVFVLEVNEFKEKYVNLTFSNGGIFKYKREDYKYKVIDIDNFKTSTEIVRDWLNPLLTRVEENTPEIMKDEVKNMALNTNQETIEDIKTTPNSETDDEKNKKPYVDKTRQPCDLK